jgi:hypothetical protein
LPAVIARVLNPFSVFGFARSARAQSQKRKEEKNRSAEGYNGISSATA